MSIEDEWNMETADKVPRWGFVAAVNGTLASIATQ